MGSIRALALCALVALACANYVLADASEQIPEEFEPLPELHTGVEVTQDPWANRPGLPIAHADLQLERELAASRPPVVRSSGSPCVSQGGVCQSTGSACVGGQYSAGLCPGAANIQCCKKNPAPATPCSTRGGMCKTAAAGCSGRFESGLCPGAADIRCCLSAAASKEPTSINGRAASCGVYRSAATSPIKGNGDVTYHVVRVAKEHLVNPSYYDDAPTQRDNTMTLETACAFAAMAAKAKSQGIKIYIASAFRTLARQDYFWNCYQTGSCNNGNLAAYPGNSNHGVGVALDLNSDGHGVYWWLSNFAHNFGFVRTVPSEDWHWEYHPGWARAPYT